MHFGNFYFLVRYNIYFFFILAILLEMQENKYVQSRLGGKGCKCCEKWNVAERC